MNDYSFYSAILGLSTRWRISNVTVDSHTGNIELHINATAGSSFHCSECGAHVLPKGARKERWLHSFNHSVSFYISAQVPRVVCSRCGEVRLQLPWEPSSLRCDSDSAPQRSKTVRGKKSQPPPA